MNLKTYIKWLKGKLKEILEVDHKIMGQKYFGNILLDNTELKVIIIRFNLQHRWNSLKKIYKIKMQDT